MSNVSLDHRQIRALYEQYGRVLLAYAYTLLPDRASSEDVLHQVLTRLLDRKLSIVGPPVHYLCRAVRNAAFNYRRAHAWRSSSCASGVR